jgi:replication factor C subunit 2/4
MSDNWVEKYRPVKLDDVYSQNTTISSLKAIIQCQNMPHMIFYGPSGSGKTSTIHALAREIFGDEWKNRIIEYNASDERGINVVRDKIKTHAKQITKQIDGLPPWKIIVLDEADTMTTDSQFALRRIIEQYSKITRFCMICNYYYKIIDPIISRCALFRFKPIDNISITNKLMEIANIEVNQKLNIVAQTIANLSKGDMRRAINLLQCSIGVNITIEQTNKILEKSAGLMDINLFNKIKKAILTKNTKDLDENIEIMVLEGYSLVNQINLFYDFVKTLDIEEEKKSNIIYKIVEIDYNLANFSDEFIQLTSLCYYIMINI